MCKLKLLSCRKKVWPSDARTSRLHLRFGARNQPNAAEARPASPLRLRPPVPPSVHGQPEAGAGLWDVDPDWHANLEPCGAVCVARPDQSSGPACRALVLVAHLSPAIRAAGGENAPVWPGAVR